MHGFKTKALVITWIGIVVPAMMSLPPSARATDTATDRAVPSVTQNNSGKVIAEEEASAIERTFEGRVRDVLSGVISPEKFAVYVQVRFRADAKIIQQYYDERAITSVPGILMADTLDNSPANNKLYSLVEARKMIVVLDKTVTAEQEVVAREILTDKMGLDPKKDQLDFRHTSVPSAVDRQIDLTAGKPSTAGWIKWVLVLLGAGFLGAVALLLWQISLLRERVNARAKLSADLRVDKDETSAKNEKKPQTPEADAAGAEPEVPKAEPQPANPPLSKFELKEKVLTLMVGNRRACALVIRRLFSDTAGLHKLAVACEAIGFEYCKQLMDSISPSQWRRLGDYLKTNLAAVSKANVPQVLHELYAELLSESLGWDPAQNEDGPFDFLRKLSSEDLKKVLRSEDPNNIALIVASWEASEMAQLLELLPEETRKAVVLQISRLRTLPQDVVQQAALKFSDMLKAIRSRHEVDIDGSEVVAKVLGTVDAPTEEALLSYIGREDPENRQRLRAHYLSFDSVTMIPEQVLGALLENIPPEDISAALIGASEAVQGIILKLLPVKQRAIIEDDVRLATEQGTVSPTRVSSARRKLVVEMRKALTERGISLASLAEAAEPGADDEGKKAA